MNETHVSLEEIDQAITAIEESRDSHLGWIGHDANSCEQCQAEPASSVGDDEHHQACIAKYDQVLRVLRDIRTSYAATEESPPLNITRCGPLEGPEETLTSHSRLRGASIGSEDDFPRFPRKETNP